MKNAYVELYSVLVNHNYTVHDILCMEVHYVESFNNAVVRTGDFDSTEVLEENVYIKLSDSPEKFKAAMEKLKTINYDEDYGGQELFGYIWLKDGNWFDRGEYDGSEWWEYNCLRPIPKQLH